MPVVRRQLSMYVPSDSAKAIEDVRALVDPIQHSLIPAHVTLCREDELSDFSAIQSRLENIPCTPIALTFGRPVAFFAHGLLLPCIAGEPQFRCLREYILGTQNIKDQKPHLTLAHPRNSKSPGNSLDHALRLPATLQLILPTICLIAQEDAKPWQVLRVYELAV